jgi:hypothetical protein
MRSETGLPGVALIFAATVAAAQDGVPSRRVVAGQVLDSVAQRPVGGAVLYFEGRRDEFHTDSYGRFHIAGAGPADTLLVVRRIGFVPLRVTVPVATPLGAVYLRPVATQLDRIAVEVEEVNRYPQLASFYRRKQAGLTGSFVTRDEISQLSARLVSEVLRRSARIEMDCSQQQIGDDRCASRNRRGRNIIRVPPPGQQNAARRQNFAPVDSNSIDFGLDRCEMDVYVDGMRSSMKVDEVPVSWVAGIEVYSGLATTPPEFGHGRCGVVAIWTTRAGG